MYVAETFLDLLFPNIIGIKCIQMVIFVTSNLYFSTSKHRLHSHLEKSLIEIVMQYFKDRTESFDDYYSCSDKKQKNCDLEYVNIGIILFIYLYNTTIRNRILFKTGGELVLTQHVLIINCFFTNSAMHGLPESITESPR
jgi:hypothetical protein